MKPFDLQDALNGAPVKLQDGTKAFILRKLNTKSEECLIGYYIDQYGWHYQLSWRENGRSELDQIDDANIVGMWEEPELTSEQVLEKAYREGLRVRLNDGFEYPVIGKARGGSYLLGDERNTYIMWCQDLGKPEICREDTAEQSQKSDTITVTLPKPFTPKEGDVYFCLDDDEQGFILETTYRKCSDFDRKNAEMGQCFRTESDAQAWLDAMKNALED